MDGKGHYERLSTLAILLNPTSEHARRAASNFFQDQKLDGSFWGDARNIEKDVHLYPFIFIPKHCCFLSSLFYLRGGLKKQFVAPIHVIPSP